MVDTTGYGCKINQNLQVLHRGWKMLPKDAKRNNYASQTVTTSKPVSKTFIIIVIAVAALVILGVLLLFTNQFVGQALYVQKYTGATSPTRTTTTSSPTVTETVVDSGTSDITKQVQAVDSIAIQKGDVQLKTDPNAMTVELEIRPIVVTPKAFLPHGGGGLQGTGKKFWVDVYLVSASKNTLATTRIGLASPYLDFVPYGDKDFQGVSGILPSPTIFSETTSEVAILQFTVGPGDPVPIMPKAKIHLGSVKASGGVTDAITFAFDPTSLSLYAKAGDTKYNLKLGSVKVITPKACVYRAIDLCVGKCGVIENGCGGVIDCDALNSVDNCASGQVCIANQCKQAVSQVLPASAPPKDTTFLTSISNVLNQACDPNIPVFICNSGKIDAIVAALIAWFNS